MNGGSELLKNIFLMICVLFIITIIIIIYYFFFLVLEAFLLRPGETCSLHLKSHLSRLKAGKKDLSINLFSAFKFFLHLKTYF